MVFTQVELENRSLAINALGSECLSLSRLSEDIAIAKTHSISSKLPYIKYPKSVQ